MARDTIRLGGSVWTSRVAYVDHLLKLNIDNPEYDKGDQPMIGKSAIAIRTGVTPQCVNWRYNELVKLGMEDYYKKFKADRKAKNDIKYKKKPTVDGVPKKAGRPPKVKTPIADVITEVKAEKVEKIKTPRINKKSIPVPKKKVYEDNIVSIVNDLAKDFETPVMELPADEYDRLEEMM